MPSIGIPTIWMTRTSTPIERGAKICSAEAALSLEIIRKNAAGSCLEKYLGLVSKPIQRCSACPNTVELEPSIQSAMSGLRQMAVDLRAREQWTAPCRNLWQRKPCTPTQTCIEVRIFSVDCSLCATEIASVANNGVRTHVSTIS